MSSVIEGYNYDIFISYRQKDNKGDRWVSDFVEALKTELESTFKEEISVYFDINPHDGLLETHDVDASLKEKLKCLILIPIISRTFCDPKSFAWEHEFKAYIEQASHDQFGLKVTLPNGNVAARVLPVRIHDLDADDTRLYESVTGGFLRGVEFIYKEPGVNRPLKPDDDEKINLNKTKFRNQINKVALAIREIIESMKFSITHDQGKEKEAHVKEKKEKRGIKISELAGGKIVNLKQEVGTEKIKLEKEQRFRLSKKYRTLIPGFVATIIILGGLFFFLNRHSRIKWAEEKAMPEIEQLINSEKITAAFRLVQKAEKYISDKPKFKELASLVTSDLTILTDPPGADVYIREYLDFNGKWKKLGRTPLISIKIPGGSSFWGANSCYLTRIEKPGYENILAMTSTLPGSYRTVTKDTLYRILFTQGTIPPGMVYVEGFGSEVKSGFYKKKHGFFIDRYEVTNKQYKEFVDKRGYSNPDYWKNEFTKDGKVISREEAMALFVDKTGRPGPSTWEAGVYPDGQADYPVSGISWYEAAAYATYADKSLPTVSHWDSGAGNDFLSLTFYSKLMSISNFTGKGPDPVGKHQGVTRFGAYDMAGNVREWCWNKTPVGNIICGGAWDDASYLFYEWSQLPAFDRSPKNGFRCVQYIDREKIPESAFQPIMYSEETDFSKITPVADNIFAIYKNRFLYDKTDLNEKVEEKDNSNEDWSVEKITFDASYGKERVTAYLFIPNNSSPPFQTLIFYPGLNAMAEKDLRKSLETKWLTDYLLKSGRAVLCPIYKGTFERIDENIPINIRGHQATDWIIKWVQDFSRSVDYLETRSDIDHDRIGYYGSSWGGMMGGIIPAIEDRLKVNILIVGGLLSTPSDMDMASFVSRVKIPTLMLNGKYDYTFPYEKSVIPFFNLLGTTNKELKIYDTDHYVPKNEMIKEVLAWCDKFLGPVK